MDAAEDIVRAVPGVEVCALDVPAVGLQSVNLATLPCYKKELQLMELEAARTAAVDALAAVYHPITANSARTMRLAVPDRQRSGDRRRQHGLAREDHYKNLKIKQDVDAIWRTAPISCAGTVSIATPPARSSCRGCWGTSHCPCKELPRSLRRKRAVIPQLSD